LVNTLAKYEFDRVHVHFAGEAGEWARVLAEAWQVPYSVTVHANDLFKPRIGLVDILRNAEPVVCIAAAHQKILNRSFGIEAALIRCGVPPEFLCVEPKRAVGPLHVVSVGRWVSKKGLDTLVESFRDLRVPARLTLASDAPRSLNSETIVVGFRPPSTICSLLAEADLFALPCRVSADGDRDGVPVAILEAMAAGVPVLTTAVSGIGEVVDSTVGWLVEPDDPGAIARVLADAHGDPEGRWRRGHEGRRRIVSRGYTIAAQVDGLLERWGWT
jgi:glycosyltransferase involved in cell wall biosynthesis